MTGIGVFGLSVRLSAQSRLSGAIGTAVPLGGTADRMNIRYQTALAISLTPFRSPTRVRLEAAIAELSDQVANSVQRRVTFFAANFVAAWVYAQTLLPDTSSRG